MTNPWTGCTKSLEPSDSSRRRPIPETTSEGGTVGRYWRALKLGMKSLLLHKLRSGLTVLGIVFGVAAVISMLAVGEGSSRDAQERYQQLGANNIIVRSVKPTDEAQMTAGRPANTAPSTSTPAGSSRSAAGRSGWRGRPTSRPRGPP